MCAPHLTPLCERLFIIVNVILPSQVFLWFGTASSEMEKKLALKSVQVLCVGSGLEECAGTVFRLKT